jgi:hypothetical protein
MDRTTHEEGPPCQKNSAVCVTRAARSLAAYMHAWGSQQPHFIFRKAGCPVSAGFMMNCHWKRVKVGRVPSSRSYWSGRAEEPMERWNDISPPGGLYDLYEYPAERLRHRRRPLGPEASCLLQSLVSFVPRLPRPPSDRLSHPPSLTTRHVALSPSVVTSVAKETTSLAP